MLCAPKPSGTIRGSVNAGVVREPGAGPAGTWVTPRVLMGLVSSYRPRSSARWAGRFLTSREEVRAASAEGAGLLVAAAGESLPHRRRGSSLGMRYQVPVENDEGNVSTLFSLKSINSSRGC